MSILYSRIIIQLYLYSLLFRHKQKLSIRLNKKNTRFYYLKNIFRLKIIVIVITYLLSLITTIMR
jgi:hypothetical protein